MCGLVSAGANFMRSFSLVSGPNLRLLSQITGTFFLRPWVHSPLQNLKWLKIRYKYMKQPSEIVFRCVYMFTRFSIAKAI